LQAGKVNQQLKLLQLLKPCRSAGRGFNFLFPRQNFAHLRAMLLSTSAASGLELIKARAGRMSAGASQ
jgi:hypothetical protein